MNNNDKIVNMLSLTSEISVMNSKLMQLVEDLQNTDSVFASLKELSTTMVHKMTSLNKEVNSYTPKSIPPGREATPSYADGINEKVRLIPTPENYKDFETEVRVDAIKAPTMEELTEEPFIPGMPAREPSLIAAKQQVVTEASRNRAEAKKSQRKPQISTTRKKEALYKQSLADKKAKKKTKKNPKKKGLFSKKG